MLVLDTDHISVLLWEGTEKALRLKDRLAASGQETVVTIWTVTVFLEEVC
jgi:hypothetical protein